MFNRTRRKQMKPAYRKMVYDKTLGKCAYCGCEITYKSMQIDHIVPRSHGGKDGCWS